MAKARTDTNTKTFTRDGKERIAYSPSEAVALVFDGWVEKTDPNAPARQGDSASAPKQNSGGSAAK